MTMLENFLVEKLPTLEDDEIDLILSPAFTPILIKSGGCAEVLGRNSVPQDQWSALVTLSSLGPTLAQFVTLDGRQHSVPLREVTIERYVHRLRLDGRISESVDQLIEQLPPADRGCCVRLPDGPFGKATERAAFWNGIWLLGATVSDDALDLLNVVEGRSLSTLTIYSRVFRPGGKHFRQQNRSVRRTESVFFSEDVAAHAWRRARSASAGRWTNGGQATRVRISWPPAGFTSHQPLKNASFTLFRSRFSSAAA
jgi:hypothetical protein